MKRFIPVAALFLAVGVLAGSLSGAWAQTSSAKKNASAMQAARGHDGPGRPGGPGFGGPGGGPVVHSEAVVATKDGKFVTVTTDDGVIAAVNGNTVTLTEGTKTVTYKTVDVDITGAKVMVSGKAATAADLTVGLHARVVSGTPDGTIVLAGTPPKHDGHGPHGGPHGPPSAADQTSTP